MKKFKIYICRYISAIYIAGDFNAKPDSLEIKYFTYSPFEFEVLNHNPQTVDMIIEYNINPNHTTIKYGIPTSFPASYFGYKCPGEYYELCPSTAVSDHRPFYVKVKVK